MRCVVTGAAGFIGSHLCERLIADGHWVAGVDNLVTGRRDNLREIINHPRFAFVQEGVRSLKEQCDADWVFHLAALADIVPSIKDPTRYHEANVDGTVSFLEWCRRGNVKKFVYAASSSCYGIQGNYPINETHGCRPLYPYALTKYVGEQYVLHWSDVYRIPAISLRLFNVYGPRHRTTGNYGAMFGTWLAQMANDCPITIVGDGTQTRDFVYVTDVADAFVKAAESNKQGVFNIGSGETHSVRMIAEFLDAKRRIHIPKRPGEPDCTWAKIGMARRELNWKPKISIQDGVKILKEHLHEYASAPVWTPEKIKVATEDWFKHLGGIQ